MLASILDTALSQLHKCLVGVLGPKSSLVQTPAQVLGQRSQRVWNCVEQLDGSGSLNTLGLDELIVR